MFSYGPSHMAEQKQDDQLESTYNSSVMIRDIALRTCWRYDMMMMILVNFFKQKTIEVDNIELKRIKFV